MHSKIIKIKGCKTCKEISLLIHIDDDGNHFVEMVGWHDHEDIEYYQMEQITFPSLSIAKRFICDYSEPTANDFANSFTF